MKENSKIKFFNKSSRNEMTAGRFHKNCVWDFQNEICHNGKHSAKRKKLFRKKFPIRKLTSNLPFGEKLFSNIQQFPMAQLKSSLSNTLLHNIAVYLLTFMNAVLPCVPKANKLS